jgi:hypothetical protein
MGYYTDFILNVKTPADQHYEFLKTKTLANQHYSFMYDLVDKLNSATGYHWTHSLELYNVKWYEWAHNMKIISEQFPHIIFELRGNGEEDGDIWKAYFFNGKMQLAKAKITFDDFDEGKLE